MNRQPIEKPQYFLREESYAGSHDFFYRSADFPGVQELENGEQVSGGGIAGAGQARARRDPPLVVQAARGRR